MNKFNLYLTKRANISTTVGGKVVSFALLQEGVYGYSTDDKKEIKDLDAEVAAGGVIYVDENLRTVDRKIEFTRRKGSSLGSVRLGPAPTIQTQEGTGAQVASEEAKAVNLAETLTGQPATGQQLGQAVTLGLKEKLEIANKK